MQLNKVLKGLLIALPVLAVTACSSSDDAVSASGNETTTNQSTSGSADSTDTTVVSPMTDDGKLSEQEQKDKVMQEQTVFFAFDNSTIASDYKDMLSTHASYLSNHPRVHVTIEGHADERGTPEYNIALGERRAEAVYKYLQALGVQTSQMSIVSYGEEKPLVRGHNEAAYAKNRRAVIVY
ncbi:peptidoglycan-associated lipoprotein Pal [Vibrio gazogenes]|uniref:Peptidoglycan-associated lipoprotein n=1 Tax=Vibrio gazogenes DSM 21264 = NBRC 103151 TaxID=1123492 RepID=A0A1M5DYK2_VIBGA|nr:peptidoglycan-associated lipoprotein Pal [Vibrio gazogenes]USP14917.1 peptidoglycan-associated lipoprotein Pal [Vibrio gazogenes]SHF72025.1 peptidoglycan-associated lipoprotein [Vibrio gazogenes DSM 21264] [Vibrio gazogenes DSM 21264 = NBRC 103151]SJN54322.1 Peptidoglycan-associated lipoprotein precursor [Vibrio gazogenes]